MRLHGRGARSAPSGPPVFDERLSVPWWWWLPALGLVLLVAFEVTLGHPGVPTWLPVAVVAPLVAWGLLALGAARVGVGEHDGERSLRVGPAHLPLRCMGAVEVFPRERKREALGPDLDPAAYLLHKPWVGPMVRVEVVDPDDPTPYWLFSTRRPGPLVERLGPGRRD